MERPFLAYSLFFDSDFVPCYNLSPPTQTLFILLCSFVNRMTFYKLRQPIDPAYILKKYGRKPGQEGNWEIVAKETKELMGFAFGFETDETGYMEKTIFEAEVEGRDLEKYMK